eukprot:2350651-Amphidinium_carterae.1
MGFTSGHAVIPWLVLHAGHVLTYHRITSLGRTPYELNRGRKMSKATLGFGEACYFRPLGSLAQKLDARWEEAAYLTTMEQSLEHVVALADGSAA